MSLHKRTGDHAMKLCDEFRKSDPRLDNPVKRSLVSLLEWAFPDAVMRKTFDPKPKAKPPEDNTPGGPQ